MSTVQRLIALASLITLVPLKCEGKTEDYYGVLYADAIGKSQSFCMTFDPGFRRLPQRIEDAERMPLRDMTSPHYEKLCVASTDLPSVNGSAIAAERGNCTFSEKARHAQSYGSRALLVISPQLTFLVANSSMDYYEINITVGVITADSFQSILELGADVFVTLYAPAVQRADPNLLVILILAVLTVAVGSYWSGQIKYHLYLNKFSPLLGSNQQRHRAEVQFSPLLIVFAVILMCSMLLGLYFFYDYLVYVIIALFVLAASLALHDCLITVTLLLSPFDHCRCRIPENNLPYFKRRPQVLDIVLFFISIGVGLWWFLVRHMSYAWVLQDFLGILFCIQMMKTIRLPNLRACVILLVLLFVYDIFFVFITPLFTKSGRSVMIDVATGQGSGSGEVLPMVIMVPRLLSADSSVCMLPYSILGFGDILVPGLLVSFCYGFDLQVRSKGIYFFSTLFAYGLGLVTTFVALILMQSGQPALLYLVPFTLVTTFLIGWRRKELRQLWTGKTKIKETVAVSDVVLSVPSSSTDQSLTNHTVSVQTGDVEEQERLLNKEN